MKAILQMLKIILKMKNKLFLFLLIPLTFLASCNKSRKIENQNLKIQTNRLQIQTVELSDMHEIHQLRKNPKVSKFIQRDINKSLKEVQNFIEERKRLDYYLSIKLLNSQFVGTVALWNINVSENYCELGYELPPVFHNNGLMSEALKAILDYAFQKLQFQTIKLLQTK